MTENKKPFIAKHGWIVGSLLLLATIILQIIFLQVIPVFLNLYHDFGSDNSVGIYYQVILTILTLAELGLLAAIIYLVVEKSMKFHHLIKYFFIMYAISLPIILFITVAMVYSPIFEMSKVAG